MFPFFDPNNHKCLYKFVFRHYTKTEFSSSTIRAVARALIGGCIFIYSGRARLVSFEIKLISKEVSRAEPEYMNIHPPN